MPSDEIRELIGQVYDLLNARDLDAAFALYTSDYVYHGPGGQELRGRDGIRGLWSQFFAAFPDLHASVEEVISEGDRVAVRWTIRGTHKGEFAGIAPTNRQIELPIMELFRISDGQLAEAWDQYDRLHLLEQLDAVPAPAGA